MDRAKSNLRAIVENMGNWWVATRRSFVILSESVICHQTSERRLSGPPVYLGDEGDAQAQESISTGEPDEWRQSGGNRIVASKIIKHAKKISGEDWLVVTLAMYDDAVDRDLDALSKRIAWATGCPRSYVKAVCKRWGEKRFKARHTGAVSWEYRIEYTYTPEKLRQILGKAERTERAKRAEIYSVLEEVLKAAKDRLEAA